jgi:hypothetical protein
MAKKTKWAFGITTDHSVVGKGRCIVCDSRYSFPPVSFTISELKYGCVEPQPGIYVCPSCILADTKTLTATGRATAEKHQRKMENFRKEYGPGAEDMEDYEFDENFCDNSDFLNKFCDDLDRLGDVSKIINHDLAVLIAKHHARKAA